MSFTHIILRQVFSIESIGKHLPHILNLNLNKLKPFSPNFNISAGLFRLKLETEMEGRFQVLNDKQIEICIVLVSFQEFSLCCVLNVIEWHSFV